jgi:hypothetical protein
MTLDPEAEYSERQLNDLLVDLNRTIAPEIECDHVTLRRLLVDYGEPDRTSDGAWYRAAFPARPLAFSFEIDELDVAATVAVYRTQQERRREGNQVELTSLLLIAPEAGGDSVTAARSESWSVPVEARHGLLRCRM